MSVTRLNKIKYLLIFAGAVAFASCSPPPPTHNSLASCKHRWSREIPPFGGSWAQSDDHLYLTDIYGKALLVLDRKTGELVRTIPLPFGNLNDSRNAPLLLLDNHAHFFRSNDGDYCQRVNIHSGTIEDVTFAALGSIDPRAAEKVTFTWDGWNRGIAYQNVRTGAHWKAPFTKAGGVMTSDASAFSAEQNVYVATQIRSERFRVQVSGKDIGERLEAWDKSTGKKRWQLDHPQVRFVAESNGLTLVSTKEGYRAHHIVTGKKQWTRKLDRAGYADTVGRSLLFLSDNSLHEVEAASGKETGHFQFPHEIERWPAAFGARAALFWEDAFVVGEPAKNAAGDQLIRLHYYTR
jgi:hypothetical protein